MKPFVITTAHPYQSSSYNIFPLPDYQHFITSVIIIFTCKFLCYTVIMIIMNNEALHTNVIKHNER